MLNHKKRDLLLLYRVNCFCP